MSRVEKVAQALKEEISIILLKEIKDPRIGFITITRVDVTADLRFARVHYSIMGNEKQIESAKAGLASAVGFVRKLIGERMKMRYTPELAFKYDDSIAYSQHISEILMEIEKNKTGKGKNVRKSNTKPDKKK